MLTRSGQPSPGSLTARAIPSFRYAFVGDQPLARVTRRVSYGQSRNAPWLVRLVWLAVLAIAVAAVGGCGGTASTPQTTLSHYLDDWGRGDWAAMRSEDLGSAGR